MLKLFQKDNTEAILESLNKEDLAITEPKTGNSLLQMAVQNQNLTVVKELIKRVDVNARNIKDRSTALLTAIQGNYFEGIQILVPLSDLSVLFDDKSYLYYAALYCNERVLSLLKEFKVSTQVGHIMNILIENDQLENAEYLISIGINLEKDEDGDTPLHIAAEHGYCRIIEAIQNREAKYPSNTEQVNQFNRDGNAPIHIAAMNDRQFFIELLLKFGANPDKQNRAGLTYQDILNQQKEKEKLEQEEIKNRKKLNQQERQQRSEQRQKETVSKINQEQVMKEKAKLEAEQAVTRQKELDTKNRLTFLAIVIGIFAVGYIFLSLSIQK